MTNGSFKKFEMLSAEDSHLAGYGPAKDLEIQVLGPVPETIAGGRTGLRSFGSTGKTKNGHSVVLRLRYKDVSVLLGGDLNIPAERCLLEHHTGGLDPEPSTPEDRHVLLTVARKVFQVDVAKSCHHGSADFSRTFLQALNPIATVISSGDEEPHSHPRADALGAIGVNSRGLRPLVFSTELARSSRDIMRDPESLRSRLQHLRAESEAISTDTAAGRARRKKLIKEFNKVVDSIERSVAVYGTIFVRTDGERVVIAQKLETQSQSKKWDIYRLEPAAPGVLEYKSKY